MTLKKVVNGVQRSESGLINESGKIYLRDVHDHMIQIIDTIESFHDMVSGMLDIYLSSISNKMNCHNIHSIDLRGGNLQNEF